MIRLATKLKDKGLYIYKTAGKLPEKLHNFEIACTYGDPGTGEEEGNINFEGITKHSVLNYMINEREEKEIMIIPKEELPTEDDMIIIRVWINDDYQDAYILKYSDIAERIEELIKKVGLHTDKSSGLYEVKYDNNLDKGNIKVALTATALFHAMLILLMQNKMAEAYKILKKIKNTLSLWQT